MRGFGLDEMKTKTPVWRARRALECSIPYRIDFHILHPLHLLFHWASVVFGANKQQLYDAFLLSHIPKIHVMKMQKLFDRRKSIQHSGNGSNMINYGQVNTQWNRSPFSESARDEQTIQCETRKLDEEGGGWIKRRVCVCVVCTGS